MELCELNVSATRPGMPLLQIPSGHLTAGFKKILNKGYGAIRREAQEWLDVHVNNLMGEDAEKVQFYSAVVIVCDAASIYVRRYGEKCLEMAGACADPERKAELQKMGDSLADLRESMPQFLGACQAAILYQHLLKMSHIGDAGSLEDLISIPGRF